MVDNFCKYCVDNGSKIVSLEINNDLLSFEGGMVCNPSIFDDNGIIRVALRNVNYFFINSETQKFGTRQGTLGYHTPDDDSNLRTENFIGVLDDDNLELSDVKHIDTSDFDKIPNWVFIGEEDIRLVRWGGKLYATGCRRDVKSDGESRMELSEIDPETGKELNRVRLSTPNNQPSYAEKNWMPIIDMPFHYIKWTTPTEIVSVNPENGDCETVKFIEQDYDTNTGRDLRGSSQVIPYKNGYHIALLHECDVWMNEKEQKFGEYYMRWVVWDENWKIIKISDCFHFMNCQIEFTNGLMYRDGYFYIPFAIYDNESFLMKVPENVVDNFIGLDCEPIVPVQRGFDSTYEKYKVVYDFVNNPIGYNECFKLGEYYFNKQSFAPATNIFLRAAEYSNNRDEIYNAYYMSSLSLAKVGKRDSSEKDLWQNLIMIDFERSEGQLAISRYYSWRNDKLTAYLHAKLCWEYNNYSHISDYSESTYIDGYLNYIDLLYETPRYKECYDMIYQIRNYIEENNISDFYKRKVDYLDNKFKKNIDKFKKIV